MPLQVPHRHGGEHGGKCIVDDEAVCAAARREIVRRYYTALCDRRVGTAGDELVNKLELLMQQAHVDPSIRPRGSRRRPGGRGDRQPRRSH